MGAPDLGPRVGRRERHGGNRRPRYPVDHADAGWRSRHDSCAASRCQPHCGDPGFGNRRGCPAGGHTSRGTGGRPPAASQAASLRSACRRSGTPPNAARTFRKTRCASAGGAARGPPGQRPTDLRRLAARDRGAARPSRLSALAQDGPRARTRPHPPRGLLLGAARPTHRGSLRLPPPGVAAPARDRALPRDIVRCRGARPRFRPPQGLRRAAGAHPHPHAIPDTRGGGEPVGAVAQTQGKVGNHEELRTQEAYIPATRRHRARRRVGLPGCCHRGCLRDQGGGRCAGRLGGDCTGGSLQRGDFCRSRGPTLRGNGDIGERSPDAAPGNPWRCAKSKAVPRGPTLPSPG